MMHRPYSLSGFCLVIVLFIVFGGRILLAQGKNSRGDTSFCDILNADDVDSLFDFGNVNLPRANVYTSVVVREALNDGRLRMSVLSPEDEVELLPLFKGEQQLVMYGGRKNLWVARDYLKCKREKDTAHTLGNGGKSYRGMVFSPFKDLPRGMDYFWILKNQAKLHVVSFNLDENDNFEFVPVIPPYFDEGVSGDVKKDTVKSLAESAGALAAVNGTFFSTGGNYGEPLGNVVVGGSIAYEVTDSELLSRNRAFFLWTSFSRAVFGDSILPASALLDELNHEKGDSLQLNPSEKVVSLIGGFGWLVRDGDSKAWLSGVEKQFGSQYYSSNVRRPQTVIGVSSSGRKLFFLTQEGYPHAMKRYSLPELASIARRLGAWNAVFADGGGSTGMYIRGRSVVRTEGLSPPRQVSTVLAVVAP